MGETSAWDPRKTLLVRTFWLWLNSGLIWFSMRKLHVFMIFASVWSLCTEISFCTFKSQCVDAYVHYISQSHDCIYSRNYDVMLILIGTHSITFLKKHEKLRSLSHQVFNYFRFQGQILLKILHTLRIKCSAVWLMKP